MAAAGRFVKAQLQLFILRKFLGLVKLIQQFMARYKDILTLRMSENDIYILEFKIVLGDHNNVPNYLLDMRIKTSSACEWSSIVTKCSVGQFRNFHNLIVIFCGLDRC